MIIFDGGMGSELEKRGLTGIPEELNITHAEEIKAIHRAYGAADIVTTATFGLNGIKYHGKYSIKEIAEAAVENARASGKKVFFDVGPTGAMLKPMGTLTFDRAYEAYAEIAEITKDIVDGYIVETFSDVYEIKACVLALKEHSDKPIFATMTFDSSARTLTGSTPEIVALVLEGLGVDALGANCSLGPRELFPIAERFLACTDVPVIIQPNRGLPRMENGRSIYDLTEDEFVYWTKKYISAGVSVVGGCCGTTPEFIRRISEFSGRKVKSHKTQHGTSICSATKQVVIENVKVCGERLNPTGKKKLKEAVERGDMDYLVDEAIKQQEAGADLLDLNVGIPKIDEAQALSSAVEKIQEYVDLPIQIDSSDKTAIERAVRIYNGVPLINSVNGDDDVMDRVFPIAKKYGAVVLGLAMDERGVPKTAKERYAIAKKIVERAAAFGIPKHKIMIDTLVLTASAEQSLVKETVEALRLVRRLGVKTALGVSNVSFGLPNRGLLNKTFLTMAMTSGLNMPIMNPLDGEMMGAVKAFGVLSNIDGNAEEYISTYKDYNAPTAAVVTGSADKTVANLYDCIKKGVRSQAAALAEKELETNDPMTVINEVLIKSLEEVGRLFDGGKLFLPQLVSSAEAAKTAFEVVGKRLPKGAEKATVVLATVKGDVHDIGKNIVKVVLESYGYKVIDLGKDVPVRTVVEAYEKYRPLAIGLSALMTTTVGGMEETIKALRAANCTSKIFVGGAVITADIAKEIDADYYTENALEFVKVLDSITK